MNALRQFFAGKRPKTVAASSSGTKEELQAITYLTAFPKSVSTWMSFIIANYFNLLDQQFSEVDFFNVHEIIPALNHRQQQEPFFKNFPKVLSTHSVYQNAFARVILIIRNPWDTLWSYYHYLRGEKRLSIDLAELVSDKKRGVRALVDHNQSYFEHADSLLIVSYEQMHQDPVRTTRKIIDYLGLTPDDEAIQLVTQRSAFQTMHEIELRKGRKYGTPGFEFTRRGVIGEGQEMLRHQPAICNMVAREIMHSPFLHHIYGDGQFTEE